MYWKSHEPCRSKWARTRHKAPRTRQQTPFLLRCLCSALYWQRLLCSWRAGKTVSRARCIFTEQAKEQTRTEKQYIDTQHRGPGTGSQDSQVPSTLADLGQINPSGCSGDPIPRPLLHIGTPATHASRFLTRTFPRWFK